MKAMVGEAICDTENSVFPVLFLTNTWLAMGLGVFNSHL